MLINKSGLLIKASKATKPRSLIGLGEQIMGFHSDSLHNCGICDNNTGRVSPVPYWPTGLLIDTEISLRGGTRKRQFCFERVSHFECNPVNELLIHGCVHST